MRRLPLPLACSLIAMVLIALITLANVHGRRSGVADARPEPGDALQRLAEQQAEILLRLERLEAGYPGRRGSRASMPPRGATADWSGAPANTSTGLPPQMSAADIAAAQEAGIRTREEAFELEPVSAAWAASRQRELGDILSTASLAREGAAVPKDLDTTCRSQTCRISMSFDDDVEGDFTKVVLLERLGEVLPAAEIFQELQPNGSIRYLVYARTGGATGR